MLDGRCCICTLNFYKDGTLSSLKCGHTFHYDCVKQWIQRSKTCPHCRKKSNINDIVKLFLDQADESFTQEVESSNNQIIIELKNRVLNLSNEAKTLRADLLIKEKTEKELKANLFADKLKIKQISVLEEQIKYLATEVKRKEEYKVKLELNDQRLKATEFYAALKRKGKNEADLDKFLTEKGDVNINEFLKLAIRQKDNWEQRYRAQDIEIHELKRLNNEFKITIKELREKLDNAKKENNEFKEKISHKSVGFSNTQISPFKDRKNHFSPEFIEKRKNSNLMFSFLDDESDKIEAQEIFRPAKRFNKEEVIVLDDLTTEVPLKRPLEKPITNQLLGNKRAKKVNNRN